MINQLKVSLKLRIIIFQAKDKAYIVFFFNNDVTAYTKRKVMYHPVRFAQGTCLSLVKFSEVFRFMKKHHCLETAVCAKNLKTHGTAEAKYKEIYCNMEDFDKAAY